MKLFTYIGLLVALVCLIPQPVPADIPKTLSYQGVLTDAGGAVVPDGGYSVTFRIYTVSTGGTPLWEETSSVTVNKGIFNVVLGHVTPLNLDFSVPYYLGISVEGGAELTPRVELTATPYSFSSNLIKGGNLFPATGMVGIGKTNPGRMLDVDGADHTTNQVGIMYTGYNDYWNSIYVKSAVPTGKPAFGYMRENALEALTFADTTGYWVLHIHGADVMKVTPSARLAIGGQDPAEALDVEGAVKLGNTATNNPGTIRWTGTDFEGYDGSTWKSLTATGGGSLPSGSYGQTLVSNGSAWVANSNLYNSGTRVGIGTTTPDATLDILGGNWDLDNTDGDLRIGDDTYKLKIGVATGGGGAGTAGIRMQGGLQRIILGGGSKEVMQIDTTGAVTIGSSTVDGSLRICREGSPSAHVRAYTSGFGGNLDLFDEKGNYIGAFEADVNGDGSFFRVYGGSTSYFMVDGYYNLTGEPLVKIEGTSPVTFNVGETGNSSVILPNDAVSSAEILDEAGVGSNRTYTASSLRMDASQYYYIATRTITAPADGYAIVIGSCFVVVLHSSGTDDLLGFGVSDAASFSGNPYKELEIPSGAATGDYRQSVTVVGVFPVTQGSNTFRFLGYRYSGSGNVFDANIMVLFVPTAYGTVASEPVAEVNRDPSKVGKTITEADVIAERAEAVRFNIERMKKELEDIARELESLNVDDNR